jgi:general secretion pathway protein E
VKLTLEQLKTRLPALRKHALQSDKPLAQLLNSEFGLDAGELIDTPLSIGGAVLLPKHYIDRLDAAVDGATLAVCQRLKVAPARDREFGSQYLLMADPWDASKLSQSRQFITRDYVPVLATPEHIQQLLGAVDQARATLGRHANAKSASEYADAATHVISQTTLSEASNDVVRFVDAMLFEAWRAGASDIHFESAKYGIVTKLRLDGVLVECAKFQPASRAQEVVSRLKVLAALDVSETRLPQDGRFRAQVDGHGIDFRLSTMPSTLGEDAVLRLLDKSHLRAGDDKIALASLGFEPDLQKRLLDLANRPNGMLLVTGPTGSGKTTTLYALLSEVQTGQDKIITIEDPVEYELPGVLQIPVNDKKGLSFAVGLRSILRHDPDRILVGEIRDAETAEIAVQAALTGHVVYTTVHANNAIDVLGRFIHLDVDLLGFASAVNGVLAQRLLRLNCLHCSQPVLADSADALAMRAHAPQADLSRLRHGTGCTQCRGTSYRGRTVISELLEFDDVLREKIALRAPLTEIKALARQLSTSSLKETGLRLVLEGSTTLSEVQRVVSLA